MTKIEPINRFLQYVDIIHSTDCWNWKGATNGRYGVFWNGVRYTQAHRYSYEIHNGRIPEGLTIDHLCRNKLCVNPNHLEAVEIKTNILRGTGPAAENARKTHCKNGHEFTPENTRIRPCDGGRECKTCTRNLLIQWSQKPENKEKHKVWVKRWQVNHPHYQKLRGL